VDDNLHTARFVGSVALSGELVFTFEGDGKTGDLLWAKFVPDESDASLLPQVIGGFYPGKLRFIWIKNDEETLVMTFGKRLADHYSLGSSRYVSKRVTLKIRDFTSSVECDTRGYGATIADVTKGDALVARTDHFSMADGC
jgi:hypothetical protein